MRFSTRYCSCPFSPSRISESAGTWPAMACSAVSDRSTHAEIELRRLAEELLEPRRVLQARDLHQNAVATLALDRGSTVPSSLTRRSMIWIDWSTDCRMRSTTAASGGVSVIRPPLSVIWTLRCPELPRMPASGCESSRSFSSASANVGFRA